MIKIIVDERAYHIMKEGKNTNKQNKTRVIGGLLWTFGERITAQFVSTLVGIILARVLDPEHFGVISIVMVFITFCNVFVTSGFSSAIIQKKEVNEVDFNTAFYIGLLLSAFLYFILFVTAPYVADFYDMPVIAPAIRLLGIRLPIAALNSVQQAYVRRKMEFKKFFIATIFGTIISGVVGVFLAFNGAGVFALIVQYLTNTIIDSIVMWIVGGWRPKLQFSKGKAKQIYSFGWKILVGDLIATLEGDIRSLVVGKSFGPSSLAYYDQGNKYPSLLITNINSSISKVMLPAYSRNQDNIVLLKEMLRKSIAIGMFILVPTMIGFAAVADTFVSVILTDKWLPSVPYIHIFCIYYLTRPMETACQQAILGIGKSDVSLKIMIIINAVSLSTMLIAVFVFHSVYLIACGALISTAVSLFMYLYSSNKYIGYSLKEQLEDTVPIIAMSLIMGGIVRFSGFINLNPMLKLICQIVIGVTSYSLLVMIVKPRAYFYVRKMISNR